MRLDDAHLVTQSLIGDTEAFGMLVERYEGAVYATAYYYAGRYGAAEDITQDAFLDAYRNLAKLREPASFGPWLKEMACRTAANWLRKHVKKLHSETPLPYRRTVNIEDLREGPSGVMERAERHERVQRAVDSLPERYRLPVILRYLQELNYKEIAAFTGDSPDEIRGILQRAGRQLRDALADIDDAQGETQWRHAPK